MGNKGPLLGASESITALTEKGIRVGSLRDEIFVQVMKVFLFNHSKLLKIPTRI